MRKLLIATGLAVIAAVAVPVIAQMPTSPPGSKDRSKVVAGTYTADPGHSLIAWEVNHFGFSPYHGLITGVSGTLSIDPANLAASAVDVTIPIKGTAPYSGVASGNAQLDAHLLKADFFDAEKFPTASFKSTRVILDDDGDEAKIEGNLTIRGVTRPVVLDAEFVGAGINPFVKKQTVGFKAETTIKRSDFGISYGIPLVTDAVKIDIAAAFEK
ncbi:YceI family protein [Sphingomonas colocasiae]|uniref:YceI family protein n=1 Tax=Sphingomonas colocasiae TaxID=1848973 RepID=A0ABS7PJF5_9SPHN|nr:YceI family protein [Sphingomonas colocasiae]MBY8821104.1 YceI family protein [Sphingomonas colocasiae]